MKEDMFIDFLLLQYGNDFPNSSNLKLVLLSCWVVELSSSASDPLAAHSEYVVERFC